MPDGLVTSRQIQNVSTGIDLLVPLYQEIRGAMMTGHVEYQIVVVTRLAAFKSAKHKHGDVVQLVVSKKFSEIDEFYHRLVGQYPKVPLPPMPRKTLFVSETDIKERRSAFDEIVRFISKDQTLATSPELLEFLGAKTTDVADFKTKNVPEEEEDEEGDSFDFFRKEDVTATEDALRFRPSNPPKPADDQEMEESVDPLGIIRSKKPKKHVVATAAAEKVKPKLSLFEEEVDPDDDLFEPVKRSAPTKNVTAGKGTVLKLFEDSDLGGAVQLGDSLLLPTAYTRTSVESTAGLDEDTEELLRVEDDFDKLLTVSTSAKPKPKPKLLPKPKPALPKKPASLSKSSPSLASAPPHRPAETTADSMDEMDILKYIQQNESVGSDSLDLFS